MKYLAVDLETTGLNPKTDQILQLGAIVEDTDTQLSYEQCPKIVLYNWRENYSGNAFALALNSAILNKILKLREEKSQELLSEDELAHAFNGFIFGHFGIEKVVVGGKNVAGFDVPFIRALPNGHIFKFHHRAIDPGMMYMDWKADKAPPDLKQCKIRAKFDKPDVAHDALADAWDVIQLVRNKINT